MPMVQLSRPLVEALGDLAIEVREGFEAGAWAVDAGLAHHESFTDTNGPRSALVRAILKREFTTSGHRLGLNPRAGQGGAVELAEFDNNRLAVIRLRSAAMVGEEVRVLANSASAWGGISDDGLWREDHFVFGWLPNSGGSLDFFVAEVKGKSNDRVPHLEFGWLHRFDQPDPARGVSFTPLDDDSLGEWDQVRENSGTPEGQSEAL